MAVKGIPAAELTPKQEAFAVNFFETSSAVEAYRRAYDVAENARDAWIYVEASMLLDNPKVALRINALKEQAAKHSIYTRHKAMEELEQARLMAMTEKNPSAAVAATNGKVKLYGLDKPSRLEVTGEDGGPILQTIERRIVRQA